MSTVARRGHIESVTAEFVVRATEYGEGTGERTTQAFAQVVEATGVAEENYQEYFDDMIWSGRHFHREVLDRLSTVAVPLAFAQGLSAVESANLVSCAGAEIEWALSRSTVDGPRFLRHELNDEYQVSLKNITRYGGDYAKCERLARVVESMKVRSIPASLLRRAQVIHRNMMTLKSDA